MSESAENKFTSVSRYVFSLPGLEDSSSVKVTDLVTIRCSSGRCNRQPLSIHRGDSLGTRGPDGEVLCTPETISPGVPVEIGEDNLATKSSLPLPMTTTDCCDDDRLLPLATAAFPEMTESDGSTTKEQELYSSCDHSIIPWLCDLEASEDQRLIDSDGDSEVEMDRCDFNRCADIRPTKRHAHLTASSAKGDEDLTHLSNQKPEPRRHTGTDRRHIDQRESTSTGTDFSDRRFDEYHRRTTKNRNKSEKDGGTGTGNQYRKNSISGDECPSVRICKTTPAFLRINPRNFHGSADRNDPQTGGGRALLSRTLDQVRRRLMDDLSPTVLSDEYEEGEDDEDDAKEIESAKLRSTYLKNLLVLGIGFMLVFTSFCALRSLQSSINHDRGLGLAALSCMNASFAVGCVFATSVVQRIRPKRAIMISLAGHLVYTVANVHATFYTLLPATVVIGFSMATLFVAQGTYLTSIAVTYAAVSGKKHDHIVSLFNGFFLFMLEVAQIFGNLISSTVFSFYAEGGGENSVFPGGEGGEGGAIEANTYSGAGSVGSAERNGTVCGSGYCHVFLIETMTDASLYGDTVVILVGVFLLVSISGMVIMGLFLDKLDVIFHQSKRSLASQLCAIVRLHRDRRLTLCAPLMTFLGMQEAFVYGEFTKAFVTCPLGVHMIGYVMICFAGCASLSSVTIGCLQKYLPRALIMTAGAVLHLVVMAYLYLWQPSAKDVLLIFVMSGLLGVADALWQTEICSLCGVLFDRRHREASFSCLRMYQSLGLSLALGYAQFLCVDVKIAILAGVLVSALVAYFGMEFSSKTKHGEQDTREPASV